MKLTTNTDITFDQHLQQASRFSILAHTANFLILPLKNVGAMPVIITLEVVQPLAKGFKARIQYIQQYEELITSYPVNDDGTQDTENPITTPVLRKRPYVDYYKLISKEEMEAMMNYAITQVPNDVTGYFNIQEWCIKYLFLKEVVAKETFNLTAENWI